MRKAFRVLLYSVALVLALGCLCAISLGETFWEVPTTVTSTGFGGYIPLTLGKDGVSQMFFGIAGVAGVLSIAITVGAIILLKDKK